MWLGNEPLTVSLVHGRHGQLQVIRDFLSDRTRRALVVPSHDLVAAGWYCAALSGHPGGSFKLVCQ